MSSSRRNQSIDLQPKFSSVWRIFCWETFFEQTIDVLPCVNSLSCLVCCHRYFCIFTCVGPFFLSLLLLPKGFRNRLIKKIKLFK